MQAKDTLFRDFNAVSSPLSEKEKRLTHITFAIFSSTPFSSASVELTGVIDAKQQRDVMTLDIPYAFVQTDVPEDNRKSQRPNSRVS